MDNLQSYKLIIRGPNTADKEQRGISSVYNLRIYDISMFVSTTPRSILDSVFHTYTPLYSRKLHILVRRARTSCVTSFTILALVFGAMVENHFASRTLPDGQTVSLVSLDYPSTKPTLSRNEKDVVDHKITQPPRDSSHVYLLRLQAHYYAGPIWRLYTAVSGWFFVCGCLNLKKKNVEVDTMTLQHVSYQIFVLRLNT